MNFKQAIKVLRARKRRTTGNEAEALAIAIEQMTKADRNREAEIAKAVELIHDAVFDSEGNLHESAWSYIKDRIDFPPDDKAEIIRRLGLDEKE
ncbi:MAG TPA: hypothetical protein PKW95_15845 [bacterium]|nr:hypothetical protein [bacterium]